MWNKIERWIPFLGWRDATVEDKFEFGLNLNVKWEVFIFQWGSFNICLCARRV